MAKKSLKIVLKLNIKYYINIKTIIYNFDILGVFNEL